MEQYNQMDMRFGAADFVEEYALLVDHSLFDVSMNERLNCRREEQ
ncbi:MAG: hypothetical protein ABFC96_16290 [Thermoguttaceae bacterium]